MTDTLLDGYHRFRAETWPAERTRYQTLSVHGQRPQTMVVSCSDSRVDPQTVFGAVPGELFVVRNVAGLVPPYHPDSGYHGTSAALEFAVRVLQVSTIVVLGHAQCGGVQAMVEGAPPEAQDFVAPWIEIARPVLHDVPPGLDPCGPAEPLRAGGGSAVACEPPHLPLDSERRVRRHVAAAGLSLQHPYR